MLPVNIANALAQYDIEAPEGSFLTTGKVTCAGAKFHSPSPLMVEEVYLSPDPDLQDPHEPTALLCPTCASNVKIIGRLLTASDGDLPWPVRREFGNLVRMLALSGWEYLMGKREQTDG